ncbi:hypothetical protein Bca101_019378 [Brassica carinata]
MGEMTSRSKLMCGEEDTTVSRSKLRCGEDDDTASRSELLCGEDATTSRSEHRCEKDESLSSWCEESTLRSTICAVSMSEDVQRVSFVRIHRFAKPLACSVLRFSRLKSVIVEA